MLASIFVSGHTTSQETETLMMTMWLFEAGSNFCSGTISTKSSSFPLKFLTKQKQIKTMNHVDQNRGKCHMEWLNNANKKLS